MKILCKKFSLLIMNISLLNLILFPLFTNAKGIWLESSQVDFADGTFERNLYASHRTESGGINAGAVEFVPRFDLNNDGYIDLFTADLFTPSYVRIYWSGDTIINPTLFPTSGAANCDAADLNGDGYADFLVMHHYYQQRLSIYWGTPTGPDPDQHFDFPALDRRCQGVFVADFNKDGYLDITTTHQFIWGYSAVFWGSAAGYDTASRTDLPTTEAVHNIEVADFNRDNWLDILFIDTPLRTIIYWGSDAGFSPDDSTILPANYGNSGSSVADLNSDGFLDLVSTAWYSVISLIYWGSDSGYSATNTLMLLPGYCYGGSSIAYMNDDIYLDIVYHRGGYGIAKTRIYWGSATGYSPQDTSHVGVSLEQSGGLVADINYDNNIDIFCNTRTPGDYSHILWGPSFNTYSQLEVNGDHKAMFREIGNVYNRHYYEDYLSSIFDAGATANWDVVEWDDSLPPGTSIDFAVRTGNIPIPDPTWSQWFVTNYGDTIPDSLNSQYIQYQARLNYDNPAYLPVLYETRIFYEEYGTHEHANKSPVSKINVSPNPFTKCTNISYIINHPGSDITLRVFDITGCKIKTLIDEQRDVGVHNLTWNGKDDAGKILSSGIYYLKLSINGKEIAKKTIYIKR